VARLIADNGQTFATHKEILRAAFVPDTNLIVNNLLNLCHFRDQILSQSSVMAFADKYQRMELSPHTLRRWFHDLIIFVEYVKFKAMATGASRIPQLDSSYTDMLVCQRSMFSQMTHTMTRRRQTVARRY
jgi:hypothetical protein